MLRSIARGVSFRNSRPAETSKLQWSAGVSVAATLKIGRISSLLDLVDPPPAKLMRRPGRAVILLPAMNSRTADRLCPAVKTPGQGAEDTYCSNLRFN